MHADIAVKLRASKHNMERSCENKILTLCSQNLPNHVQCGKVVADKDYIYTTQIIKLLQVLESYAMNRDEVVTKLNRKKSYDFATCLKIFLTNKKTKRFFFLFDLILN